MPAEKSIGSPRLSNGHGDGQRAGDKPKKSVTFNPVVEYFYYDALDTTPEELRRLDNKKGQEGRLLPFEDTVYGL